VTARDAVGRSLQFQDDLAHEHAGASRIGSGGATCHGAVFALGTAFSLPGPGRPR
jgi:hypothetical protein